ncbi:MAG: UDP-glucose dehydrogenase family protein [Candidatus Bipolaricaulota bacterium]
MKIAVIGGSGYVGFITGLGFARLGNQVTNVDIDRQRVEQMNSGKSPIYEEDADLDRILQESLDSGNIEFTTEMETGVRPADVVFIAVGTPQREDGEADLSQVIEVAEELVKYIDQYKVVVMKSTVPVGTIDLICNILSREKIEGEDFDVVSNPEFLREGKGLYDFFNPSRLVLGSTSQKALKRMRELYSPFLASDNSDEGSPEQTKEFKKPQRPVPLVETDIKSAQMIKYASNAFLATRISFINEIAGLCEEVGADVTEVSHGMGYDDRIGHQYLEAGIGFGGPCLEKDLKALIKISENHDYEPGFLDSVLDKNKDQIKQLVSKVKEMAGYPLYKKIITVYGLAFKPGTNDVRTSLSLEVIDQLRNQGAEIKAHDPQAIPEARELKPDLDYFSDPYRAAEHSDALLILTDWPEYNSLDYAEIAERMTCPRVIDGRNTLEPGRLKDLGFQYAGIGRGQSG